MKSFDLDVPNPSVVTGTFTLHHAIDASSPLFDILQKGHDAMLDAAFALNVTFQGLDSVYHDDVVAIHRYRFSNDLLFDHTFAWLSRRDARTGKMAIDFDRLNEVVPAAPAAARPVLDASSAGRLARPCLESYEALGFCPQARAAALEKEIFVVRSVAATVERRAGPSRRRVRADALVRLRRLRGGRARALVGRRGGGGGREPLEALRKRLERRDAAVLSARRRRALALRGRSVGEHVAR